MKKKKTHQKAKIEKRANVDSWLERETSHKREALENASRHFNKEDALTVNTLEAVYGQESSFGKNRRKRGIAGASGDFQMERETARRMGLTVSPTNDERFDIDPASAAEAKYLKTLDKEFSKKSKLKDGIKTFPVKELEERKKFALAAYNAGEGRIASAQAEAKEAGKDPSKWSDVKDYLAAAGADPEKTREAQEYVDNVLKYEGEFERKSKADKEAKSSKPKKARKLPVGGHWITVDGNHIFVEDE